MSDLRNNQAAGGGSDLRFVLRGAYLMDDMIWWLKTTNHPPMSQEMTDLIDRAKLWTIEAKLNRRSIKSDEPSKEEGV